MTCPTCQLHNPETATHCDCGYSFRSDKVDPNYYIRAIAESTKSIQRMMFRYFLATALFWCVWLAVTYLGGMDPRIPTAPEIKSRPSR